MPRLHRVRRTGWHLTALTVGACAAWPAAAAAEGVVIGQAGKVGDSAVGQSTCKYRMYATRGVLEVGVPQPAVTGADRRGRTLRERPWVRYRVHLTDPGRNSALVATSSWSGWLRLRQRQAESWSSPTIFSMDWWGHYGADVRIEWWNRRRIVGWRAYRMTTFHYYDQFNIGPVGPMSSCFKPTWDRPLPSHGVR